MCQHAQLQYIFQTNNHLTWKVIKHNFCIKKAKFRSALWQTLKIWPALWVHCFCPENILEFGRCLKPAVCVILCCALANSITRTVVPNSTHLLPSTALLWEEEGDWAPVPTATALTVSLQERNSYLQKLNELHLPVLVQIYFIQNIVECFFINLYTDALDKKKKTNPKNPTFSRVR